MGGNRNCSNCNVFVAMGNIRRGRCRNCAKYLRLNGVERPRYLWGSKFCDNCKSSMRFAKGRCSACYVYHRRHGCERPLYFLKDAKCKNCKKPLLSDRRPSKGLCENCYQYLQRHDGRSRPQRLWGTGSNGWCDCGQPAVDLIEDIPVCSACLKLERSEY